MDSTELFSYKPKTISSYGSIVSSNLLTLDSTTFLNTTCHSINLTKKSFLIHDFGRKGSRNHEIHYLNQDHTSHKISRVMDYDGYEYAFLLDENKIIYYDAYCIFLFENNKSRKLFESDRIYFRLDDSKNIIVLYANSEKWKARGSHEVKFKITILKKEDNYKPTDCREYNVQDFEESVRLGNWNYDNLLFVSELNENILNYYKKHQLDYIVLVRYDDKNNYYDLLIYVSSGKARVDRWTENPSNKWIRTEMFPLTEPKGFYLFNLHFDRQIITNYCCSHYNFGTIVTEMYNDWQKRMLEILKDAIEKLSTDLLKVILAMCIDTAPEI